MYWIGLEDTDIGPYGDCYDEDIHAYTYDQSLPAILPNNQGIIIETNRKSVKPEKRNKNIISISIVPKKDSITIHIPDKDLIDVKILEGEFKRVIIKRRIK